MWESMCDIKQKGSFLYLNYVEKKSFSPEKWNSNNSAVSISQWQFPLSLPILGKDLLFAFNNRDNQTEDQSSWWLQFLKPLASQENGVGNKRVQNVPWDLTKKAGILHMRISEGYLVVMLLREPTFLNTSKGDIKDTSDSREGSSQALP